MDMEKCLDVFQADPTSKTVEETWNKFKEVTYSSIDSNVPSKYKSTRFNLPWINRTLSRLIERKNRAFCNAKAEGTQRQSLR